MKVIVDYFPGWRGLHIHEGSPGFDNLSSRLARECAKYTASQYNPKLDFGRVYEYNHPSRTYSNENLESQSFQDSSFDIVITQDVFEHVFNPEKAIREIARTLKPNGATIMTVPIVMKTQPSRRRASLIEGSVNHLIEPPQYHGNPIDGNGALVTIDWGYDIVSYLQHHSGLSFLMIQIDNIDLGIRAELIEVLIGFKRPIASL
jgi:SAM-dependent methyltransferase